jgi:hypothetical protein
MSRGEGERAEGAMGAAGEELAQGQPGEEAEAAVGAHAAGDGRQVWGGRS